MSVRKKITIECAALTQLCKRVGRQKAAEELGVSPTTFTEYFKTNEAPMPVVLAARYVLSKMDRETNSAAIAIVVVPADKRAGFDAVVQSMGLDCKVVMK